ncbi:MAG: CPBP family intramembrane metalloprotease [Planctomycetes bacterium]|nr:CPBP family intramembrane metalloprotease [Planctomycetota bacterium]
MEGPGTAPEALPPEPPAFPAPTERRFGPGGAILVFLAYFGAQFVAGFVVGIVSGVRSAMSGRPIADLIEDSMPAIVLLSLALGGAAALLVARALTGPLRAGGRFALRHGSASQLLLGAGTGALLGLLLFAVTRLVPPTALDTPLTRLASTEAGYWALLLVALVLAPPIEEFVFRGVMYEGLRARMPAVGAMLIVTILFTALHATELVHYPPGFLLIALLSVATLLLRTATGSLFPPVAAHFVYNLFAVVS